MILKTDLSDINKRISDRSDCFYWQTDRKISVEEAGNIWKDRHGSIENSDIINIANKTIDDKIASIEPVDLEHQNNQGNVNSVRNGVLESGTPVIIRCHPKGIKNGYFYAESAASKLALDSGMPTYKTYFIHESLNENDCAFQVIEKLPGLTMTRQIAKKPNIENRLVYSAGVQMANIHKIKTDKYGPFNNDAAKSNILIGLHDSFADSVRAALGFNLSELVKYNILTQYQASEIDNLFDKSNPLLNRDESVLVHNDFADHNLLSDENSICGIIDFDECVSSNPVSDIACWSTFYEPKRLEKLLDGYFDVSPNIKDFDELFQLLRLRYTISKMTLRIRRYNWNPLPQRKEKIEIGQKHMNESLKHFKIKSK